MESGDPSYQHPANSNRLLLQRLSDLLSLSNIDNEHVITDLAILFTVMLVIKYLTTVLYMICQCKTGLFQFCLLQAMVSLFFVLLIRLTVKSFGMSIDKRIEKLSLCL